MSTEIKTTRTSTDLAEVYRVLNAEMNQDYCADNAEVILGAREDSRHGRLEYLEVRTPICESANRVRLFRLFRWTTKDGPGPLRIQGPEPRDEAGRVLDPDKWPEGSDDWSFLYWVAKADRRLDSLIERSLSTPWTDPMDYPAEEPFPFGPDWSDEHSLHLAALVADRIAEHREHRLDFNG